MNDDIRLIHQTFREATGDVKSAADRLERDRDRIDARVTGFLNHGWTGVAAESFVDAWREWKDAADDIWRGLDAMHQLLGAAQADFIESDAQSQEALDRISAHMLDRLEG